jgi:methyl-accepting chemotaxis protein
VAKLGDFSISKKISIGYVVIIVVAAVNAFVVFGLLQSTTEQDHNIDTLFFPTYEYLTELKNEVDVAAEEVSALTRSEDDGIRKNLSEHYLRIKSIEDSLHLLFDRIHNPDYTAEDTEIREHIEEFRGELLYFVGGVGILDSARIEETFMHDEFVQTKLIQIDAELSHLTLQVDAKKAVSSTEKDRSFFFTRVMVLILSVVLTLIGIVATFLTSKNIKGPLKQLDETIEKLSLGDIPKAIKVWHEDEIGHMSHKANELIESAKKSALFALAIGEGHLDKEYQVVSEKDTLGHSLLQMRDNLIQSKEKEEKRREEDDKVNWRTAGLAQFGEVLRVYSDSMDELCDHLVSDLVKYLDANQGAILVRMKEGEDEYMELMSAYAYERKKFLQKRLTKEDGLIGQCWQERARIYLTKLPDQYVNIESGLGTSNPRNLLVQPLISNDVIIGILEIASFHKMEDYQLDFVERISGMIASTVSNAMVAEQTKKLLSSSQELSEQLQAQEEELRQNTEEMLATQEELSRKIQSLEDEKKELTVRYEKEIKALKSGD